MLVFTLSALAAGFTVAPSSPAPLIPGTPYVLLSTEITPTQGEPVLVQAALGEYGQEGTVAWEPGEIPPTLAAWQGRTVVLTGEEASCTTTVRALKVIRRMSWMDGFSDLHACTSDSPACKEALRQEVLEESQEQLLVGELDSTCGIRRTALTQAASPVIWARDDSSITSGLRGEALEHLYALPQYQKLLAEAGELPYPLFEDDALVRVFSGPRKLVSVTGSPSFCGDYQGEIWAVWEILPSNEWRLLFTRDKAFYPDAILETSEKSESTPDAWDWYAWDGMADRRGMVSWAAPWEGCAC